MEWSLLHLLLLPARCPMQRTPLLWSVEIGRDMGVTWQKLGTTPFGLIRPGFSDSTKGCENGGASRLHGLDAESMLSQLVLLPLLVLAVVSLPTAGTPVKLMLLLLLRRLGGRMPSRRPRACWQPPWGNRCRSGRHSNMHTTTKSRWVATFPWIHWPLWLNRMQDGGV